MSDFNWEFYISYYDDLKKAGINTRENALNHWNRYGKNEGRICNISTLNNKKKIIDEINNNNFNWVFYINYYDDLRNMKIDTPEKALNHWNRYGKHENRICNFDKLDINIYNKINFIDGIIWINLDRSTERKNKMEKILEKINIKNYRISAVDGKIIEKPNLIYERIMSNYEIACTQSHIKAIKYLSELSGNYFMVCEDDICFNNLYFIKNNLENIIKNAPKFDILIIHKIYLYNLEDEYTNWNDHINKYGIEHQISGTACYIISKDGINNVLNKKDNFDVADMYLYKNMNTFVYKYNFTSVRGLDSEIHSNHLEYQNKSERFQNNIIIQNYLE